MRSEVGRTDETEQQKIEYYFVKCLPGSLKYFCLCGSHFRVPPSTCPVGTAPGTGGPPGGPPGGPSGPPSGPGGPGGPGGPSGPNGPGIPCTCIVIHRSLLNNER